MGLPYAHALDLPHGRLLDLIAVEQIKTEGFTLSRKTGSGDFWSLMERT